MSCCDLPPTSRNSSTTSATLCLAADGLTQIYLTNEQRDAVCNAFECASSVMDDLLLLAPSSPSCRSIGSTTIPMLDETSDSYNCTGYHPFGGSLSSRYNKNRQGFVFSNGELFSAANTNDTFEPSMRKIRNELDAIALQFLTSIEEQLHLSKGYFLQVFGLGATSLMEYSQWHIKRYRPDEDTLLHHILPVHTDPSILSIIVHDSPGINEGGLGLEYAIKAPFIDDDKKHDEDSRGKSSTTKWKEIPLHGHGIATVMIGAAFGRVMNAGAVDSADPNAAIRKLYPPVRHRVRNIYYGPSSPKKYRMAITYFLRPAAASLLQPLPIFKEKLLLRNSPKEPPPMRFDDWYKRVSSRYRKSSSNSDSVPKKHSNTATNNNNESQHIPPVAKVLLPRPTDSNSSDGQNLYDKEGPNCTLLYPADATLVGREQYLGGELGLADGHVYAIPGCAKRVLKINPESDSITMIGPSFEGHFKWLRSVQTSRGIIYGLPCHADCILRIDTHSGDVSTIACNLVDTCVGRTWKYHGGAISPIDGCIYCVPTCADHILKIDPSTDEVTLIGGPFIGKNKWYGALVGNDGAIYGIPHNGEFDNVCTESNM